MFLQFVVLSVVVVVAVAVAVAVAVVVLTWAHIFFFRILLVVQKRRETNARGPEKARNKKRKFYWCIVHCSRYIHTLYRPKMSRDSTFTPWKTQWRRMSWQRALTAKNRGRYEKSPLFRKHLKLLSKVVRCPVFIYFSAFWYISESDLPKNAIELQNLAFLIQAPYKMNTTAARRKYQGFPRM